MSAQWQLHFVDSHDALADLREQICASIARAETRVTDICGPLSLDIVVQNIPGRVIPELGLVGFAPTSSLVQMTFDATNDSLADKVGEPLERMVAHEVNHVLRWRGPGYGATLGEAIISEGLAGQFTRQLYANAPEHWEVPEEDDLLHLDDVLADWGARYDHAVWFFGAGDKPHWLGYRLGYRIVGRHIEASGKNAADLTQTPAIDFLETVRTLAA